MKKVEIYFRDLSKEKQKEVLEAYGMKSEEEMNWDVFPIDVLYPEPEEEGLKGSNFEDPNQLDQE